MDKRYTLESLAGSEVSYRFKSEGEKRIAGFLDENSIKYQYEQGVLVNYPMNKPRIWYPDFYLPEFGAYIEYFGLSGRQNYDRGIKAKETSYSKTGLNVIPVYPWTFNEDWRGYIMRELKSVTIGKYWKLMSKPYWGQQRSLSQFNYSSGRGRYNLVGRKLH
ncbi:MAG: hypothetical protein CVU57_22825 [Deltaproteobacteria bacterium HGW-Deltaproteobacteria-15]|jgi:hypothetical protein|nr:MAG: hypothetical protein CVU57_22825 [Deltaproteobacteria bacterium HGW-Deltaproteobacteria-15]